MGAKVPMVFIDNGSALNMHPFRTALKVGLSLETIIPSPLTVRAHDNTSRKVMGTFKASCKIGKGMTSSHWSYSFYFSQKDEDPMEGRNCCSTW